MGRLRYGMGDWLPREERNKQKGKGGKGKSRSKPHVIYPPEGGWPGGLSDKNGCRWRKGG